MFACLNKSDYQVFTHMIIKSDCIEYVSSKSFTYKESIKCCLLWVSQFVPPK